MHKSHGVNKGFLFLLMLSVFGLTGCEHLRRSNECDSVVDNDIPAEYAVTMQRNYKKVGTKVVGTNTTCQGPIGAYSCDTHFIGTVATTRCSPPLGSTNCQTRTIEQDVFDWVEEPVRVVVNAERRRTAHQYCMRNLQQNTTPNTAPKRNDKNREIWE